MGLTTVDRVGSSHILVSEKNTSFICTHTFNKTHNLGPSCSLHLSDYFAHADQNCALVVQSISRGVLRTVPFHEPIFHIHCVGRIGLLLVKLEQRYVLYDLNTDCVLHEIPFSAIRHHGYKDKPLVCLETAIFFPPSTIIFENENKELGKIEFAETVCFGIVQVGHFIVFEGTLYYHCLNLKTGRMLQSEFTLHQPSSGMLPIADNKLLVVYTFSDTEKSYKSRQAMYEVTLQRHQMDWKLTEKGLTVRQIELYEMEKENLELEKLLLFQDWRKIAFENVKYSDCIVK